MAQAIDLRCDLRNSLVPLGEYEQIGDYLHQAETLAEGLQDQRRLGRLSAYMAHYFWATVHHTRAVEVGQRARALATELGDLALQIIANHIVAYAYHDLSDYRPAMDLLRQNIALLEGDLLGERFGQPRLPTVESRRALAWCLSWQGAFAEAITLIHEADRLAKAADHPGSLVDAFFGGGLLYLLKGDSSRRSRGLNTAWPLTGPCKSPHLLRRSRFSPTLIPWQIAWRKPCPCSSSRSRVRRPSSSCPAIRCGLAGGAKRLSWLAISRRRGSTRRARSRFPRHSGNGVMKRMPCGCSARSPPPAMPEMPRRLKRARQALALAEELGMRPLQAHCHRALGTLYAKIGRWEEARAALSAAIELYRAMAMTFWLPQAEAALAQVEGH